MPNKFKNNLSLIVWAICYCTIAFIAYKLRTEYPIYTLILMGCLIIGAVVDTIRIKQSKNTMEWAHKMLQTHPDLVETMKNRNN